LGGRDPYSASNSCQDIVVQSFRESYFSDLGIALSSVRGGNVIGCGDWAKNRLVPDIVREIVDGHPIIIRNPKSVKPWQHVLEPVYGMLLLAQKKKMFNYTRFSGAWNFDPISEMNVTDREIVDKVIELWGKGKCKVKISSGMKEANFLSLDISKANRELGFFPRYDINKALKETVEWYKTYYNDNSKIEGMTNKQVKSYSAGEL